MVQVKVQHFPEKLSNGFKYKPIQVRLANRTQYAAISKSNQSAPRTRQTRKPRAPPMISFLPKLNSSLEFPKNLFCYQEWSGADGTPVAPIEGGTLEDISGYVDLDSSDAADLIVVDECDGTFVVAKMSRQKSSQMGGKKFWKETRTSMTEVIKSKPDIHRGDKNGGHNSHYICFGHRKEQKKSGELGEYAFKSNTSAGEAEQINCKIDKLVGKMELVGSNLTSQMPEHKHFVECKKKLDLPSVAMGQDQNFWPSVNSTLP